MIGRSLEAGLANWRKLKERADSGNFCQTIDLSLCVVPKPTEEPHHRRTKPATAARLSQKWRMRKNRSMGKPRMFPYHGGTGPRDPSSHRDSEDDSLDLEESCADSNC